MTLVQWPEDHSRDAPRSYCPKAMLESEVTLCGREA